MGKILFGEERLSDVMRMVKKYLYDIINIKKKRSTPLGISRTVKTTFLFNVI